MKHRTLLSFLVGLSLASLLAFSNAPVTFSDDLSTGKVDRKSGKYVFVECEPLMPYDVAFDFKTTIYGSVKNMDEITDPIVQKAIKYGKRKDIEFDGVIIKSGQLRDVAIKFK